MNNSLEARNNLAKKIKNGAVLIHSGHTQTRNNDVLHPFRQNSNFYYLTGWPEPEAHAVIIVKDSQHELHLFVKDRNEERETWDGKILGQEEAIEKYNATKAYSNYDYSTELQKLLAGITDVYCDYNDIDFSTDAYYLKKAVPYDQRGGQYSLATIYPLSPLISELRLIKSKREIELLKTACDITVLGHIEAMKTTTPKKYEYQVAAEMEKVFYDNGAERLGYPSIVAGGKNSCILHYSTNREVLNEGELLLIDAAAEFEMYSSDVTRTFPIHKKFSSAQKDVYNEVLKAQNLGIDGVVEGNTMRNVHKDTISSLSESMVNLGLVPLGVDDTISMAHFFEFFMHGTGHWLGLDVHDAGSYETDGKPRKLKEGMVTTIEPGIYVRPTKPVIEFPLIERDPEQIRKRRQQLGLREAAAIEAEEISNAKTIKHEIPKELLGIGVRIEDDILCTTEGPSNLTEKAPKTIEDIEAITS